MSPLSSEGLGDRRGTGETAIGGARDPAEAKGHMTMKAWVYERYGSPDVLGFEEVETPRPAGDEVAVRVRACGLNAADWHVMRADPFLVRLRFGLRRPRRPMIAGCDVAGVVESVGERVTRFSPGDHVYGGGGIRGRARRARDDPRGPHRADAGQLHVRAGGRGTGGGRHGAPGDPRRRSGRTRNDGAPDRGIRRRRHLRPPDRPSLRRRGHRGVRSGGRRARPLPRRRRGDRLHRPGVRAPPAGPTTSS